MENKTILLPRVEHTGLAKIIGLAAGTVKRWQSSEPWRLPAFIQIGRNKFYLLDTINNWLLENQQQPSPPPVANNGLPTFQQQHHSSNGASGVKRGRGRPRKVLNGGAV